MTYSKSIGFGAGQMFMTPIGAVDNTPVRIGIMQNVSMEFSFDEKPLYGTNQFPEAVARGKAKLSCKCSFAQIDAKAIGTVFLGGTPVVGQEVTIDQEAGSVSTDASHNILVAGHTNFTADLGVSYATTGQPLKQVTAGSETTACYSVAVIGGSKGTYSFSAGDSGVAMSISYQKNDGVTGFKTQITNQRMGSFIPFQTDLYEINPENVPNTQWGARLYKCSSSKLTLATKQDDWIIPDMDWSCYANPAGVVLELNTPN